MATMAPCRVCQQQVAKGAKACPHCGAQTPAPDAAQTLMGVGCLLTLVPVVIVIVLVVLALL